MSSHRQNLVPEEPHDAGVADKHPRPAQEEAAHQLAMQARSRLAAHGFSKEQVFEWADTFVAERGGGNVEEFLSWIEAQES